jgi:hypothetical protein
MDSRSLLVARFASQWPGAKPSPRHKAMGRVHDTATFSQPTLAVLDKLRARCLAYLGALEEEQNGKPWLKAGKRRFLVFGHPGTDPQLAFATTKMTKPGYAPWRRTCISTVGRRCGCPVPGPIGRQSTS